MQPETIELQFPVGGLHQGLAYQSQPPFTTPDALNVRAFDPLLRRYRGGSRPGLLKGFTTLLNGGSGDGKPVYLLTQTTSIGRASTATLAWDRFDGAGWGSQWSTTTQLPTLGGGLAYTLKGDPDGEAIHAAITAHDPTSYNYDIALVVPSDSSYGYLIGSILVMAKLNDTTPNPLSDALFVRIRFNIGLLYYEIFKYSSGVRTTLVAETFWGGVVFGTTQRFRFTITPANNILGYVNGLTLFSSVAIGTITGGGKRFGFVCEDNAETRPNMKIGVGEIALEQAGVTTGLEGVVVAGAYDELYRATASDTLTANATAGLTIASGIPLQAVSYKQTLYIADRGTRSYQTNANGSISAARLLTDPDVDLTTLGISLLNDMCHIIAPAGIAGVYTLLSFSGTGATLGTDYTGGASAGNVQWRVERGPKAYAAGTDTLALWIASTGYGFVPLGCKCICKFLDRLVLAGDPYNPHAWFMSRAGSMNDWDYAADPYDVGRAVAGPTADAGDIGEPITALIPFHDDYLIFGCRHSLWILRGNPALGTPIENLSYHVGCVDNMAWTQGPSGEIYVLSFQGVFVIPPGGGRPEPLSQQRLPKELINVDPDTYQVSMAYANLDRGIYIFLSRKSESGGNRHWFYDLNSQSFWSISLAAAHEPLTAHAFRSLDQSESRVLVGCRDGYVRQFDIATPTDDGTAFDSYVLYGPIMLGDGAERDGILNRLRVALALGSGNAQLAIRVGESAEAAYNADDEVIATLSAGVNYSFHPKRRGNSAFVKLSGVSGSGAWGVETVVLERMRAGLARKV